MGSAVAQCQIGQGLKQHKQALFGLAVQQFQCPALNAGQPWQGVQGGATLVEEAQQVFLQVKPAALDLPAHGVVGQRYLCRHARLRNNGQRHPIADQVADHPLVAVLPGIGITLGDGGAAGPQRLAVGLVQNSLPTLEQQHATGRPHIHRHRPGEVNQIQRKGDVLHGSATITGTRAASAHISS